MLDLQIGLNRFSDSVAVYLSMAVPGLMADMLVLTSARGWKAYSEVGVVPWKHNVTGPIDATLLGEIPLSRLPAATYYFALLVTPTGTLGSYFFWITSLDSKHPVDYSS